MPIRFRCPGCEGLLSIATRKAGMEIGCPKCGEALIVPPPMEPDPEPVPPPPPPQRRLRAVPDDDSNAPTEMDLKPLPRKLEPAGVGAGVKPAHKNGPAVRSFHDGIEPPAPPKPPKPEEPKPKAKPKLYKPGEEPLFEGSDIERLLDPGVKKAAETAEGAKADGTKPEPGLQPKPLSNAEALKQGLPVVEDGVYISRGSAIMVAILFVFLLALAFAAGFWAGS